MRDRIKEVIWHRGIHSARNVVRNVLQGSVIRK